MVRKVGTTSGNEERDGPAARWENETVRKSRIVRFLTCSSVHVRAPPSAIWKHTKGREEEVGERRGSAAPRSSCGIGGASGNGTADEGSNGDGVRTKPRSDFHSYSEITGGGTLVVRSFDEHPIISRCEYTLTAYIRSPWNLAIHTYESADVSFRIDDSAMGLYFCATVEFKRESLRKDNLHIRLNISKTRKDCSRFFYFGFTLKLYKN